MGGAGLEAGAGEDVGVVDEPEEESLAVVGALVSEVAGALASAGADSEAGSELLAA